MGEADHHQPDQRHADNVLGVDVARQLWKPSSMNTRSRMNAQAATPQSAPSAVNAIAASTPKARAVGKTISGTVNAGLGPIRMRPSMVADPVAITTGRKWNRSKTGSTPSWCSGSLAEGIRKALRMQRCYNVVVRAFFALMLAVLAAIAIGVAVVNVTETRATKAQITSSTSSTCVECRDIRSIHGEVELFASKAKNDDTCALLPVNASPLLFLGNAQPISCDAQGSGGHPVALVIDYVRNGNFDMALHIVHIKPSRKSNGRAGGDGSTGHLRHKTRCGPMDTDRTGCTTSTRHEVQSCCKSMQQRDRWNDVLIRPKLYRPLLAANRAGLWMGLTPGGFSPSGHSPIYFVSAQTGKTTLVWRSGASNFRGISTSKSVWFEYNPPAKERSTSTTSFPFDPHIVMFNGAKTRPVETVRTKSYLYASQYLEGAVIGDNGKSAWTIDRPIASGEGQSCGPAKVVQIKLTSGDISAFGDLQASITGEYADCNGLDQGQAIVAGKNFLLLKGQAALSNSSKGYARLYSVNISHSD